ncbi:MAG: PIG-L family deacetylase [Gammaproteobacteria bacterium]|nr:PIG-L family deacetylase [Gammaproteobacteria bacterium]
MESRLTPYQAVPLIECTAALVFAPHPDDETLGCGGLLAACHAAGIPTYAIIVTSGDFGDHGKAGSAAREAETRAAAEVLGIGTVQFWREPDRGVACNELTIAAARQAILDTNADLILTPSFHEIHPDHRATAWIVIEATRRLAEEGRNLRLAMYEVGAPLHRVDVLVDITAHEAAKRAAIAKYVSQLSIQPYDAVIFSLNHFRTYTLPASVKYAEAFCILDADTLKDPARIIEAELLRQERLGLATVGVPEGLRQAGLKGAGLKERSLLDRLWRRKK